MKATISMRRTSILISCIALVLFCTGKADAAGIPELNLAELIDAADLIAVGKVQGIREISTGEIQINEKQFPAKVLGGEIVVTATLKGGSVLDRIPLQFSLPITPAGSVGYRGIPSESYRLVFLKRSGPNFGFVSPYYPFFPAVAGIPVRGDSTMDQVVYQLAAAVQGPQISRDEKMTLLFALRGSNSPMLIAALRSALATNDKVLQLSIAAALLERNDLSALAISRDALLHPEPKVPRYVLVNLSSAISTGLRDDRGIPDLSEILKKAPEAYGRRSAASALRNTASRNAIAPLGAALRDSDLEVRYYAVIGLAEITNNSEWRPLMDEFQSHEQRYLTYWRDWVAAH
jgi:hypothetical protein